MLFSFNPYRLLPPLAYFLALRLLTNRHGPDGRSGSPDDPKGQSYKKELVNPIAGNFLQVEHFHELDSPLVLKEGMH
jgi:hypothetical protein